MPRLAGVLHALWVALFSGGMGAIPLFTVVYIDKRGTMGACVGGESRVPRGPVLLT